MSSEQAAQFEHDVNVGAVLLPPSGQLKKAPAAPLLPAGVVRAYNDTNSGMTTEQRQQVDTDLRDGVASLPRAAKLNPWRAMTAGENARRSLGVGTRAVIEGLGDVAGIVMNPLNAALNATGLPQKLTGKPLAMANDPSVNIPDMLGLPKPQFDSERLVSAAERGATAGLATWGVGSAAGTAPGAIGLVGRALSAAPVADVVSGATGGASAEAAHQEGYGPVGQLVAGLAGGGIGVGAMAGAERAGARLVGKQAAEMPATTPREVVIDRAGELTDEGQELVARHGFTPDEIKQAYAPVQDRAADPLPSGSSDQAVAPPRAETTPAELPIGDAPAGAFPQMVRRYEGVDHPVEIVGPEQADAADRVHVQVRGTDTGDVGFVPKDEIFPSRAGAPGRSATIAPVLPQPEPLPAGAGSPPPSATGRTAADRTRDAEALGIPLTRGQATQDFAIQDTEQTLRAQASGEGDKARTFLVDQADKIKAAALRFREGFGGADVTKAERGQTVKDALRELRDQGKAGISALYREAQAMGGDGLALDHSGVVDSAKRVLIEADVPDGVKNVVRQEMARYGMIGRDAVTAEDGLTTVKLTDGRKVQFYGDPEPLTVGNAEKFRQAISAQYTADGPRKLSQSIKRAVDDAVETAVEAAARNGVDGPMGEKLRQARQAVVAQKETFSAKDVVQKLIDWKKGTRTDLLLPEHAIRDVLAGEVTNLKRMKAVLLASPTMKSKTAWTAVQAEGVGGIFDKAYTANSNLGAGPAGTISGAKLNSEIIRFGVPKLKVLLDEPDFNRLMSLRRVIGEATVPVAGTTNPSGSAFKLMRFLTPMAAKFSGIPLAGPVIDVASGLVKRARETAEANRTLAGMTGYSRTAAEAEKPVSAATTLTRTPTSTPDESANGFIQALADAARSGRLTASLIASQAEARQQGDQNRSPEAGIRGGNPINRTNPGRQRHR